MGIALWTFYDAGGIRGEHEHLDQTPNTGSGAQLTGTALRVTREASVIGGLGIVAIWADQQARGVVLEQEGSRSAYAAIGGVQVAFGAGVLAFHAHQVDLLFVVALPAQVLAHVGGEVEVVVA